MILMTTVAGVLWLVLPQGKGPNIRATTLVLTTATALLAITSPALASLPTPITAATAKTYLASLTVASKSNSPEYNGDLFKTWNIISGTCDTRESVLKRDGTNVVTNSVCSAISGHWVSPYDGVSTTLASNLDIDHIVPLKEAWVSGAHQWTNAQREAFANDLTRPQLVAVTDNLAQSKRDQDPSRWLPPLESFHCTYIRAWVQVKHYYNLDLQLISALTRLRLVTKSFAGSSNKPMLANIISQVELKLTI
ncbi:hypothetical protein BGZ92_011791 [Podila epicladia]|nr:hypothetical protein BGZ92_011791 [Podila epicladia]